MKPLLIRLVRLFPEDFRQQFGEDLIDQLSIDYDRARQRSVRHGAAFAVTNAFDLIRSGLLERLRPSYRRTFTHGPAQGASGHMRGMKMGGGMSGGWMTNGWIRDLVHAARSLRRAPGFVAIATLTLGLAVGANAGIFSIVDAVLLDPLPYPEADELVYIAASAPGSDFPEEFGIADEFYVQYSEEADLLSGVATYNDFTATLRVDERVERVPMSTPTISLFATLGVSPMMGRLPVAEDEGQAALISHGAWATWFGSDPNVIGRSYDIIGESRTIVGIMPPDFGFPNPNVLLWIPNDPTAGNINLGRFGIRMVGRLAPGADIAGLVGQLGPLAQRLPERYPETSAAYASLIRQHRPVVRPLTEELLGDASRPLWILLGSVAIVLLIACANITNLFTVRVEGRQRDLAVRRALGAGRGALIRGQMSEAALVAVAAGALGMLMAWAGTPAFLRAAPDNVPRLELVEVGGGTLLFTAGLALFIALACGLLPSLRASSPGLSQLRDAGRGSTRKRHWGRDGLIVAQTALALVLLIGSGLLLRSFWELRNVDAGYETADIFTFQIAPDGDDLNDGPSYARFHTDFMARVAALPSVESVGVVGELPLDEGVRSTTFQNESMAGDDESGSLLNFTWTGGDYFGTMDIEVLQGRAFTAADHQSTFGNAIVSEAAANLLWPGQDPIGRQFRRRNEDIWDTVVGVVEDIRQQNFREAAEPLIYYPLVGQTPDRWAVGSPGYVVKTTLGGDIAPEVRALVREVAPNAPMYAVHTMESLASDSMVQLSFTMLTIALAAVLALLLGAIGLYGILAYVVTRRTQEIGVRMALGARAREVQQMVVAQGARVVLVGVAIGLILAAITTRVLTALLFEVNPLDLVTFVATATVMIGVGLLASYIPARRASTVDPVQSLRSD
ncbi:MAG: ABC transporter permease [Longimicrobiales bacterium]